MQPKQEYEDFKIPGSEISVPILILHGKKYMEVAQRLVWFNHEKADWVIETEVEFENDSFIRFKAVVKDPSGKVMRVARKSKTLTGDKDYESCETGAIGRALALLGYGTAQALADLSEGDDPVDAPITKGDGNDSVKGMDNRGSKPPGKGRGPDLHDSKGREENNNPKGPKAPGPSGQPNKPSPKIIGADSKATSGIWTGKTFEEIFNSDKGTDFKWTKARFQQLDKGDKLPQWSIEYLDYAASREAAETVK